MRSDSFITAVKIDEDRPFLAVLLLQSNKDILQLRDNFKLPMPVPNGDGAQVFKPGEYLPKCLQGGLVNNSRAHIWHL